LSNGEHIRLEDLELFALSALPENEADALRAHLSTCAECSVRLAEARGHASLLAFAVPQERPAGTIKAELMARVRANLQAEEMNAWPSRVRTEEHKPAKGPASGWLTWVLASAAVLLALVSFALSWQNRNMAARLQQQRNVAESSIRQREQIEKLVGVLASPDTMTVKLAGIGEMPNATGMVKFNSKAGLVLYQASNLPDLPAGKSYQMWLVPTNGAPISAGLLGQGGQAFGNLWMAAVPANVEAKAFAVTVEPAGGTDQPTGPKVLLGAT
jgi:Anti-sigma-K factor rskA/Putative zinc-finger